jgi:hypothetical protein
LRQGSCKKNTAKRGFYCGTFARPCGKTGDITGKETMLELVFIQGNCNFGKPSLTIALSDTLVAEGKNDE